MNDPKLHPAGVFMHLIITHLAPMFLVATNGNLAHARAAAIEIITAHNPRNQADLLPIAQIIAFSLAVLSSLSLAMTENIPIPLILRLRGNATSLNRAAAQCRRSMSETSLPGAAPRRRAEPSEAGRRIEEAVLAELSRTQQHVAGHQTGSTETPPTPAPETTAAHPTSRMPDDAPPTIAAALDAMAADSQRRIDEAEAALNAPTRRPTKPEPRHIRLTEDEAHDDAWSNAMADVAREVTPEIAGLPPPENRAAGIRVAPWPAPQTIS